MISNDSCGVCLGNDRPCDFETRCSHLFHYTCLNRWLANNPACPTCRKIVSKNQELERIIQNWKAGSEDIGDIDYKVDLLIYLIESKNDWYKGVLEDALKSGWNINSFVRNDLSVLMIACSSGNTDAVTSLLGLGADFNARNSKNQSALHFAITNGDLELLRKAFEATEVDIEGPQGYLTPLILAICTGKLDIARFLVIERGADVNAVDLKDHTALFAAWDINDLNLFNWLIDEAGADVQVINSKNQTILHVLSSKECEYIEYIRKIIASGGEKIVETTDVHQFTALHYAAHAGRLEIVKELLKAGASVDALTDELCTPLHFASYKGQMAVVELLIEAGSNINALDVTNQNAFLLAALQGHLPLAKYLQANGADIHVRDKNKFNALLAAANRGHRSIVEYLIDNDLGFDVNDTGDAGFTALHFASFHGRYRVAVKLIKSGAKLDLVEDRHGTTPLLLALSNRHIETANALISSEADCRAASTNGTTALHSAVRQGDLKLVTSLLMKHRRVNVNAQDSSGWTPLHYACATGFLKAVAFLLESGADTLIKNNEGMAPEMCVGSQNRAEIIEMIRKHESKKLKKLKGEGIFSCFF